MEFFWTALFGQTRNKHIYRHHIILQRSRRRRGKRRSNNRKNIYQYKLTHSSLEEIYFSWRKITGVLKTFKVIDWWWWTRENWICSIDNCTTDINTHYNSHMCNGLMKNTILFGFSISIILSKLNCVWVEEQDCACNFLLSSIYFEEEDDKTYNIVVQVCMCA